MVDGVEDTNIPLPTPRDSVDTRLPKNRTTFQQIPRVSEMMLLPTVQVLLAILLAQFLGLTTAAAYHPRLLWSHQLGSSGSISQASLRQGNAVVLSNEANPSLWIVDDAGTLHIVETSYSPARKAMTISPPKKSKHRTESRSKIVLHEKGSDVAYAVFSVVDVPKLSNLGIRSRVFTVVRGPESGSIVSSVDIEGVIEGSPVLSRNGNQIFVTHSVNDQCRISKMEVDVASATITGVNLVREGKHQCSPASIEVTGGTEILFWGEHFEAFQNFMVGEIHRITASPPYETLSKLPRFEGTIDHPPAVSADGNIAWIGGSKAFIHGLDLEMNSPLFSMQLPLSERNLTQAVTSGIVSDPESNRIFVASASNSFHCLNGLDGHTVWSITDGFSIFLSPACYSPRDNNLYTIEHLTGRVARRNADTGEASFHFDCTSMTWDTSCSDSVEADFAISYDRSVLFYGDIFGRINALEVADPVTVAPSTSPPSTAPSILTEAPTTHPILPRTPQPVPPSQAPVLVTTSPVWVQTQQSYDAIATTAPVAGVGKSEAQTSNGHLQKSAFALLMAVAGLYGV